MVSYKLPTMNTLFAKSTSISGSSNQDEYLGSDTKGVNRNTEPVRIPDPSSSAGGVETRRQTISTVFYKKLTFGKTNDSLEKNNDFAESDSDLEEMESKSNSDDSIKFRIGAHVATRYGTATVLDFRHDDNIFVLQFISNSIAYFYPDTIVREIKCVVGERVKTKWGLATVEAYYIEDDMYSIALDWRWDDDHVWRMKATTKMFDKISKTSYSTQMMQNMQKTAGNYLSGSYSTFRSSTSTGYNSIVTKLNSLSSTTNQKSENTASKHKNATVSTPYGQGKVLSIRGDNFFVVQLAYGATAYLQPQLVALESVGTSSTSSPVPSKMTPSNISSSKALKFNVGDQIKTTLGNGIIREYRKLDKVYEIELLWNSNSAIKDSSTAAAKTVMYASSLNMQTIVIANTNATSTNLTNLLSSFLNLNSTSRKNSTTNAPTTGNSKSSIVKKNKFNIGDRVQCKFGIGTITQFRSEDEIYEVCLYLNSNTSSATTNTTSASTASPSAKMYISMVEAEVTLQVITRFSSFLNITKKSLFSTGEKAIAMKASASSSFTSVKAILTSKPKRNKYVIDERLLTPYGSGFIDLIRPDGIYVVKLRKLNITAYFHEKVLAPFPYDKVTHYIVNDKQIEIPRGNTSLKMKRTTRHTVISSAISVGPLRSS